MIIDNQEQPATGEALQRRGVPLLEKTEDLRSQESSSESIKRTKPIIAGSLGSCYLYLQRYKDFDYHYGRPYFNPPGYTIDEKGNILEGATVNFINKGYYSASIHADGPKGSRNRTDLKANLWIGNGHILSGKFTNINSEDPNEPDQANYVASFSRKPAAYFFLPPDPELLKKLRVSFESLPEEVTEE